MASHGRRSRAITVRSKFPIWRSLLGRRTDWLTSTIPTNRFPIYLAPLSRRGSRNASKSSVPALKSISMRHLPESPPLDFEGRGTARSAVEGASPEREYPSTRSAGPPPLQRQGRISPHDIVSSGLCIGCGVCGARMKWDRSGFLKPDASADQYDAPAESFSQKCPFSPAAANEDDIAAERFAGAHHADARIGRFEA